MVQAKFSPLAVARLEADHFVCLAKRQDGNYEYMEELCNLKVMQNEKLFQIHARCGIFHIGESSASIEGMINRARLAEERGNEESGKCYTVYTSEMKEVYMDYVEISSELVYSIKNEDFQIYYQPIMDCRTGEIASAEALVRWQHPEKGMISPGVFIPVLEKNGSISKLDRYVMKQVRKFQKKRLDSGLVTVPISVNLSGIDFFDESMMEEIIEILEKEEIPNGMIRFEITETAYGAMEESSKKRVDDIRSHNVKILMDDFGQGYSSFGLLQDCSMDILKIDMAFIRQICNNPKTRSILRAIIDLSHQLNLKVVAEGVERRQQLEFLRQCGCDYIQGYYYARPLSERDFEKMLEGQA